MQQIIKIGYQAEPVPKKQTIKAGCEKNILTTIQRFLSQMNQSNFISYAALSAFLLLMVSVPVAAQQTISLQQLIDKTLQENYQLQLVRNWEQMAQNNNTPGNAGFLPSVNLRGELIQGVQNTEQRFFNGDTRSGDNARSSRQDAIIELDWVVFDGFRMFALRDQLHLLQQVGNADTRYYIEQTVADISGLYYQLVKENKILASLEKSLEISEFRLKLEKQKRNVGTGNALLYHQALIDFNADSALLNNHQMIIRDLQIQINRLINAEPGNAISPALSAVDLNGLEEPEVLLQKAMENNRNLERTKLEEMIAEANFRVERAARYPQISVFGNYSYNLQNNEVGFLETSTAYGAQYGIRVRFNLYDGGRQNTRIKNVLLEQENASIVFKDTRVLLESQLASLTNRYESFLTQYRLLESSLEAAEKSLEIAREQLQTGAISGFEFRQAQLASLRVENQLTEFLFSLKTIEIDIFRLTGDLMDKIM